MCDFFPPMLRRPFLSLKNKSQFLSIMLLTSDRRDPLHFNSLTASTLQMSEQHYIVDIYQTHHHSLIARNIINCIPQLIWHIYLCWYLSYLFKLLSLHPILTIWTLQSWRTKVIHVTMFHNFLYLLNDNYVSLSKEESKSFCLHISNSVISLVIDFYNRWRAHFNKFLKIITVSSQTYRIYIYIQIFEYQETIVSPLQNDTDIPSSLYVKINLPMFFYEDRLFHSISNNFDFFDDTSDFCSFYIGFFWRRIWFTSRDQKSSYTLL